MAYTGIMDHDAQDPNGNRALIAGLLMATASLIGRSEAAAIEIDPEALRPGLVASYRSLVDPGATLHRIDLKPAFYLGHSSPHPRLPPGPFEVVWEGLFRVREPGPIAFH